MRGKIEGRGGVGLPVKVDITQEAKKVANFLTFTFIIVMPGNTNSN